MIVLATQAGFEVTDKDRFDELHVEVGDLTHAEFLAAVRNSADVKLHEKPRHLWISNDFLRKSLNTGSNGQNASSIEDMLAYAGTKGWLNDTGSHVMAHILLPE